MFTPQHDGPVYEMQLPFYTPDVKEAYWVGFCLRGGQGFNEKGFSIADPSALYMRKPQVMTDCLSELDRVSTVAVSVPQNPQVSVDVDNQAADLSWEAPEKSGSSPIAKYKIFV